MNRSDRIEPLAEADAAAPPRRTFNFALRFPLLILALLFAVIWGLVGYLTVLLKHDLEPLLSAQQFASASVIAADVDREIRLRWRALDEVAQVIGRRALIADPDRLSAFLHDSPMVGVLFNGGFFVLDAAGICLAEAPDSQSRVGLNLADRDYFNVVRNRRKPMIGAPTAGRSSERPSVGMSAPINNAAGEFAGVLVGLTYLDAGNFIGRIIADDGERQGRVLIVDPKSGRFVAATDPDRIFRPIPVPGTDRMHDRYMAGYEGSGIAHNAQGVEELSSGRRIPATDWFAVVTLPTTAAFAPTATAQKTILGAALFLSLVIPLLAALLARYWLAPLRGTTQALRDMTSGRRPLDALPVTSGDEIGQLVVSFNQLQQRIHEKERLLREQHARLRLTLDAARMRFVEWTATAKEPVARLLLDLVCLEDRNRVAAVVERDLAVHGQFLVEFRSAATEKITPWFMARGRIYSPCAPDRQAIAIVWDITEFKMAELALYENEEKFEAIVDSLNDAVSLHDGETGAILCVNIRTGEMYGYPRSRFRQMTFADLGMDDPQVRQEAQDRFAQALQGEPQCFEWRARDAQGRLFWVEVNVRATVIGDKTQLVVVVRDIDEQKKAAYALRQSEERYRLLLDLSPDAVFVHRDGVMVMANRSALRLFGAEREEQLLGLPWTARVHPDCREAVEERLQQLQRADGPMVLPAIEQRYLRVDGSVIDVEVTASTIPLTEGRTVLAVARDISRRKANEARLRTVLTQQEALLDNALVGIVLLKQRVITQCNRRFEEMFGYDKDEMIGYTSRILYPSDEDYAAVGERAYSALGRGEIHLEELRLRRKDGSVFWGYLHGRALDWSRPNDGSVWIYTDRTEQKQAEERLQLAATVFENAAEGILITDANNVILATNQAFSEITGYAAAEVIGKKPNMLKSDRHDLAFYRQMWRALHGEGKWRGEIWNRRRDGEVYPEILSISVIKDGAGRVTHYVAVFTDIAEQKRSEDQLNFLTHYDPLTELPNRILFNDRLIHSIHRMARDDAQLAVFLIDLDRFKAVNDTLGHPLGDQLLCKVAQQLEQTVRVCDTLARLGGDEFILLIENITGIQDTVLIAQKLLNVFMQPFILAGYELYLSASIGITFYPNDGKESHELIKNAEAAMYQAKARSRNTYHYYAKEMTAYAVDRLQIESMLRRSIERNELVAYFQPQVDLVSGALIGAEALVRWRHPTLGLVPPIKFIPLAEETGFISALGEWVLRDACLKLKLWRAAGYQLPRIAVNLSIKQFERSDVVHLVERVLSGTGLPPDCLELEITESFIVKAEEAIQFLDRLHSLGVHLSVDDFGTGYSSLMYLKQLPIQKLKIDRCFVMDIGRDDSNEAIVRTIIALARNLGLAVIAEGVETLDQAKFLLSEGCLHAQGYYYDKPLPENEFVERWLSRRDPDRND